MDFYKLLLLVLMFILSNNTLDAQKSYNNTMFEGNKRFESKDYAAAATRFLEATKINSKDFAAAYNLGNAFYKNKNYEEAISQLEKASKLSKTPSDKASALHNLGNTYMQMNKPEKAAEFYKQSLKQDPSNEATRKNYEIAKLKQEQNQQRKQQKNGKNGNESKNKDDNQQQKEDADKKEDGKQGNNNGPENNGQDKDGKKPQDNNGNKEGNLPKDLQDAILNRVSEKEKETAKRILNKDSYSLPESNEKDW